MEAPAIKTVITRSLLVIALLIAGVYGMNFYKKHTRKSAIVSELRLLTTDSSFYRQFYAEDASKTLIRCIGLIGEAKSLGMEPSQAIDRALNVEKKYFGQEDPMKDASSSVGLIRSTLMNNFDNALKLGYKMDFRTVSAMKKGELPPIPSGPHSGDAAEVMAIIDPTLSPGIEKVVSNLAIRPPGTSKQPRSDVDSAAAKQLTRQLLDAEVIERDVAKRITNALSPER
ncbi:MAG: hypothetical protein V4733_08480 [Verrucomicrobiota bacterium]